MKIKNNTKTTYIHGDFKLPPNEVTEVKDEKVAKIWLSIDGIVEYVAPEDAKLQEEALKAEIAKLKAENAALKEDKELVYVEEKQATMTKKEAKKTTKKGK